MNYFAAESLIKARLKSIVSGLPPIDIISANDLDGAVKTMKRDMALFVIFYGDEVDDQCVNGRPQSVTQLWAVIAARRNVRSTDNEAARADIGVVISTMLNGIQGHPLSYDFTPLVRRKLPGRSSLYVNGYSFFSFLFATKTLT